MAKRKTRKMLAPKGTAEVLRETWNAALDRVTAAEAEVEKQVGRLIKKNKINPKDAKAVLTDLTARVKKERKRAAKEIDARLKTLQARVKKERKAAAKMIEEGVQQALAAFNIPSRSEVAELTHKIEQLSHKIDGLKRRR